MVDTELNNEDQVPVITQEPASDDMVLIKKADGSTLEFGKWSDVKGWIGSSGSFAPNLIIELNTTTPTGVLASKAAFEASLITDNPDIDVKAFVLDVNTDKGTSVLKIEAYGLETYSDNLFSGNAEIVSLTGNGTTLGYQSFLNCSNLVSVSLPLATTLIDSVFHNCSSLVSVSLPSATTLGVNAFQNCSNLVSVSLPSATTLGDYAFENCSNLVSVSLPSATTLGDYAFLNCGELENLSLPSATTLGDNVFENCVKLRTISLPSVVTMGTSVFNVCIALTTLIVLTSSASVTEIATANSIAPYILANV